MMVIYMIAFFTIPAMVCFVIMDYEIIRLDVVNIPIYAICWLDIILNCITGHYDKKTMSVELKSIKIFQCDIIFTILLILFLFTYFY